MCMGFTTVVLPRIQEAAFVTMRKEQNSTEQTTQETIN